MSNHISHASLPYPVRGARFTVLIPYADGTGSPLDPTSPDTELSIDGAAFADAAEEVTTISGSNGFGYLTLTGAEMDCSAVALAAKATGPLTQQLTIYPRLLPVLESGTAQAGSSSSLTLANAASWQNLTGCILKTTGGTGGGGTGGANNQARVITAYNVGTKVATVAPNWETTPDNTTTYDVLFTENCQAVIRKLTPLSYLPGTNMATGYPLGEIAGTVSGVTSSTVFETDIPAGGHQHIKGAALRISNDTGDEWARRVIVDSTSSGGVTTITIDSALDFSVDTGSQLVVEDLAFGTADRTLLGNVYSRLGAPTGASVSADVAAVLTAVLNVQNGTFINTNIPQILEVPDAGSATFSVVVVFADETGTAKNLDSGSPTMTLVNGAGTDLSARLGAWTNPATGKYVRTYTNSAGATVEPILWEITGTVNTKLRRYVALTQLVDTTAVDFTTADRTKLNALHAKLPSKAYLQGTDLATGVADTVDELLRGTINAVDSQTQIAIDIVADFDHQLDGCTIQITDVDGHQAYRTILASLDSGGLSLLTLDTAPGFTLLGGEAVVIGPPTFSAADRTKLGAIHAKLPTKSRLTGTNLSDGDLQLDEAQGTLGPLLLRVGVVARSSETDQESYTLATTRGKTLTNTLGQTDLAGCQAVFTSSDGTQRQLREVTGITLEEVDFLGSPTTFVYLAVRREANLIEPWFSYAGGMVDVYDPGFAVPDRERLTAVRAKLPSRPFLAGTNYSDGALDMTGASGLAPALTAALATAEIEFPVELLDVFRDHLLGGQQYVKSRVDISTVTPTLTKLAGHAELSDETSFYSRTNSVVAFVTGPLQGLCNVVVSYDGPSRTFYFDDAWPALPQAEDQFIVIGKIVKNT